jgi:hypothetical protein
MAEALLLAALDGMVGLSALGWVTGVTCALVVNAALGRGLYRVGSVGLGPADRVTLVRATLVCAVAALTAHSYVRPTPALPLVALSVVALVLDGVDGWVARRTGTASALGALFDQEVDAFLILILSVQVAPTAGAWVLAIGAARYAFLVAAAVLAQGGRGGPRDRADVRGSAGASGCRQHHRAGRGPGPAHRVVRPGRVVALEAAAGLRRAGGTAQRAGG